MEPGWERWESYFYPETYDPGERLGVLRNLFDERDPTILRFLEYDATRYRMREIDRGIIRIPQTYDLNHLRAIHRHLFQDVYEWAGEIRDVRIKKSDDNEFARPRRGEIHALVGQVHEFITSVDWQTIDRRRFVNSIATTFAFLNQAHPFREGNGRTGQAFLRHVAAQSPFQLDYSEISRDLWDNASALSGPRGERRFPDPRPLLPLFHAATKPDMSTKAARPHPTMETGPMTSGYDGNRGPELQ